MSKTKELNFFVEERNWRRGIEWYERQFPGPAAVRGEASPHYTAFPRYHGVAGRMAGVVPDAWLVYAVRDPIERAISAYSLTRAMGLDERPAEQALVEDFRDGFYVAEGRYWMQLDYYLDHFAQEQILVIDQHDLLTRRSETLARIFRFVGVDDAFESTEFEHEHNPTPASRRNRAGSLLVPIVDRVLGADRSRRVRASAPRLFQRPFARSEAEPKVPIDDELRAMLSDLFAEDVRQLREFTGMEFASWGV